MHRTEVEWRPYLDGFHADRAGITERVLAHCRDASQTPYQWAAAAVRPGAEVLDVACGSGPLSELLRGWIGIDRSDAELRLARARHASPLIAGDAADVPAASERFDVVVCSMGLMLFEPMDTAIAEMARVLRPGGKLILLLPATRPLRALDRWRYGRMLWALRLRRLSYPNEAVLRDPESPLAAAGLVVSEDERRRFECHLANVELAELCVRSLYLAGETPQRIDRASRLATGWVGSTLGVPIRRIVASRRP